MKTSRLLILTANRANRALLEKCLASGNQVVTSAGDDVLDMKFDLAILDAPTLGDLKKQVKQRRDAEHPTFLPFLLFLPRIHAKSASQFL